MGFLRIKNSRTEEKMRFLGDIRLDFVLDRLFYKIRSGRLCPDPKENINAKVVKNICSDRLLRLSKCTNINSFI